MLPDRKQRESADETNIFSEVSAMLPLGACRYVFTLIGFFSCTFEIPSCSGTSQIGCVAEVNRSFSWKIKTIGYQSKSEREYKCNDSVRKGLPFRKEKVSSDERYKIIVSITNKSKRDGSFALILF